MMIKDFPSWRAFWRQAGFFSSPRPRRQPLSIPPTFAKATPTTKYAGNWSSTASKFYDTLFVFIGSCGRFWLSGAGNSRLSEKASVASCRGFWFISPAYWIARCPWGAPGTSSYWRDDYGPARKKARETKRKGTLRRLNLLRMRMMRSSYDLSLFDRRRSVVVLRILVVIIFRQRGIDVV